MTVNADSNPMGGPEMWIENGGKAARVARRGPHVSSPRILHQVIACGSRDAMLLPKRKLLMQ